MGLLLHLDRPHEGKYLNDSSPLEYGYQREAKVIEFIDNEEVVKLDENDYEITENRRFYLFKNS